MFFLADELFKASQKYLGKRSSCLPRGTGASEEASCRKTRVCHENQAEAAGLGAILSVLGDYHARQPSRRGLRQPGEAAEASGRIQQSKQPQAATRMRIIKKSE